jgi:beta-galactosidase
LFRYLSPCLVANSRTGSYSKPGHAHFQCKCGHQICRDTFQVFRYNDADQVVLARSIVRIVNKSGAEKARWETGYDIQPHAKRAVYNEGDISNPDLWSVETPNLYKAIHEIYMNEKLIGREEIAFGIRRISFSVDSGFQLNGKILKLKDGCVHHA